jgi:hypothetical protein
MPATTRCLLLGAALLLPWCALAQGDLKPRVAPAAPTAPATPEEQDIPDPPARAGRLAAFSGGVSLRDPGQPQWQPAERNLPIATGSALWTEARGRALLELPGVNLGLESGSGLEWTRLDDAGAEASLAQGQAALLVHALDPDDVLRIATPRGTAEILKPGRYVIEAGAEGAPSRVVVQQGHAAWVQPDGQRILLGPGRALATSGEAPAITAAGEAAPILAWTLAQEPKFNEVPQSVALMPGGRQLAEFGRWSRHPEYGDIWRPEVPAGWVPFREGNWRWTDPWGWTWRDAQPWGFATSHYGRWFEYDGAWAWAPVVVAAPIVVLAPRRWPVFTPAVVGFFGPPGRWGGGRPVGWAPLAPHEPFWPGRRFSAGYVQRVNAGAVRDAPGLGPRWADGARRLPPPAFANWRGATAVPGPVFAGARPVGPNRLPFNGPPQAALPPPSLPPRPLGPAPQTALGPRPGLPPGLLRPGDAVRPGAPNAPMLPPLAAPGVRPPVFAPSPAALPPGQRPGFTPPFQTQVPGGPQVVTPPLGARPPLPNMPPLGVGPGARELGGPPLGARPPSPNMPPLGAAPGARELGGPALGARPPLPNMPPLGAGPGAREPGGPPLGARPPSPNMPPLGAAPGAREPMAPPLGARPPMGNMPPPPAFAPQLGGRPPMANVPPPQVFAPPRAPSPPPQVFAPPPAMRPPQAASPPPAFAAPRPQAPSFAPPVRPAPQQQQGPAPRR